MTLNRCKMVCMHRRVDIPIHSYQIYEYAFSLTNHCGFSPELYCFYDFEYQTCSQTLVRRNRSFCGVSVQWPQGQYICPLSYHMSSYRYCLVRYHFDINSFCLHIQHCNMYRCFQILPLFNLKSKFLIQFLQVFHVHLSPRAMFLFGITLPSRAILFRIILSSRPSSFFVPSGWYVSLLIIMATPRFGDFSW